MRVVKKTSHATCYRSGAKLWTLFATLGLSLLTAPIPLNAASLDGGDTAPGDSCAGFPTGASRLSADSDADGSEVSLICDGSVWRAIAANVPEDPDPCTAEKAGTLRYNSTEKTLQLCHGSAWIGVITANEEGDTATPVTGDGYFVITDGTWDGDLATAAGADYVTFSESGSHGAGDKLCLDDLTANDWMGKADATARGLLTLDHVKAFLCSRHDCNDPLPSVEYFFAVSGDATAGGASFTADADSVGPNDSANWSGSTYFDGSKEYWSNRETTSSTQWDNRPHQQASESRCEYSPGWTAIAADNGGAIGITNATNNDRWDAGNGNDCNIARHLVCMVHP